MALLARRRPATSSEGVPSVPGVSGLRPLDSGSNAVVYEGVQDSLGRAVAVKVLNGGLGDARRVERFRREGQAIAALSHPNVITIYDANTTPAGQPYLVMHLARRGSLARSIAESGPLPVVDAVRLGIRLAGALAAAHALDPPIVHRDVKPQNVLLGAEGDPLLADFGIAVLAEQEVEVTELAWTLAHAAPETLAGSLVASAAADVYSLCSTLYEALVGVPPFPAVPGQTLAQQEYRILTEPVPALAREDVPQELRTLLRKGLSKDQDLRPTAVAFALSLHSLQLQLGYPSTPPVLLSEAGEPAIGWQPTVVGSGPPTSTTASPALRPRAPGLTEPELPGAVGHSGTTSASYRASRPAEPAVENRQRSRLPVGLGLGAAALLVVGVAVVLSARSRGAPDRPAAAPAPPAATAAPAASAAPGSPAVAAAVDEAARRPTGARLIRTSPTTLHVTWSAPATAPLGYTVASLADGDAGRAALLPVTDPTATSAVITVARPTARYCAVVTALFSSDGAVRKSLSDKVCT